MSYVERVVAEKAAGPADFSGLVAGLAEAAPALAEYMALGLWPSGEVRATATLLVFVEDSVWKGCLHDRANGRRLWRAGGTWQGLLDALERALAEGTGDWRRDVPPPGRGRK